MMEETARDTEQTNMENKKYKKRKQKMKNKQVSHPVAGQTRFSRDDWQIYRCNS